MKSLTVQELKTWMENPEKEFQLIDVREAYEFEEVNLNGELIPLGSLVDNVDRFSRSIDVVVQCKSGMRSANAIKYLEQVHGYTNLYNLEGGIMAYINAFGQP
jgi:rhodanese-related sulfurtransferase